jgi:uncharacterized integral membrane protein
MPRRYRRTPRKNERSVPGRSFSASRSNGRLARLGATTALRRPGRKSGTSPNRTWARSGFAVHQIPGSRGWTGELGLRHDDVDRDVKGPSVSSPDGTPALGAALGFSAEELELNRSGRLSAAQNARLQSDRRKATVRSVVVGLLFLVIFGVIAAIVIPQISKEKTQGSSSEVPIVIGVLAFMVFVLLLSLIRTRISYARRASGRVDRVEGVAKTRVHRVRGNVGDPSSGWVGYGGGIRYELKIGGHMFFLPSRDVLHAFEAGQSYRGFYVGKRRTTATLLSVEPIPTPSG